jgi:hypothetical protein
MQIYGLVILSFMAGVIWGFATKATGDRPGLFYACRYCRRSGLSLLPQVPRKPALWRFWRAFVAASAHRLDGGMRAGLAPPWWMRLRLLLTTVVAPALSLELGAQP